MPADEMKRTYRRAEDNRLDELANILAIRYREITGHRPSDRLWQALRDAVEYETL